jgi:hypothetical protein
VKGETNEFLRVATAGVFVYLVVLQQVGTDGFGLSERVLHHAQHVAVPFEE